ncbi:MAG: MotA/TolQ/ExbB proton channel family protein [Rhodobacterales bacterium]|nr:MotA/TolQ/ExbB proton channel family protein [Rhodobacterales bacterium]
MDPALPLPPDAPGLADRLAQFLAMGGPAMWAIAALSVATLALILWKVAQLFAFGAWSGGRVTERAVALWQAGQDAQALALLAPRRSIRAQLARAAMTAAANPALDRPAAEAEAARVGRALLAQATAGLRGLELAATLGPLLGLLGTVTGMIAAFQALQDTGARADPATLAGGIWEALLTTAAGMAVAIPASAALTWFDSVAETLRHDMEDAATRILHRAHPAANGRAQRATDRAAE